MKNVFLPEAGILLKTTRVIETRKFMEKRVISTQVQEEDMQTEFSLRPMSLEEYVGKNKKHVACIYRGGMSTTGTVGSCAVLRSAGTW